MSIPPITMNYPLTTFHFDDVSSNYTEITPNIIKLQEGSAFANATAEYNQFKVEGSSIYQNSRIYQDGFSSQNGAAQINLTADSGLFFYNGDGINYTYLTQHQLNHRGNVAFDISLNALSFRNVSSGGAGEVIKSDASGAPYWATESLSDVLAVSANASQADITNVKSIQFTNVSDDKSVVLTTINVSANLETLNISTSPDFSGSSKEFTRAYLPLGIGGIIYYLPLYTTPT